MGPTWSWQMNRKKSLAAAAILGILICMVLFQWQGFADDDDSADAESDNDSAGDDDSAAGSSE